MGLIDAYDALQSDRVNDKQQFTDAVFVLKGVGALGVDDTRRTPARAASPSPRTARPPRTPAVRLRRTRTLFLPGDGADAQFVTKPDAESGNELLRLSLKSDIHKLSMVPDLTDEQFAGNVSGVAMRFKLLGLEQLTKIKERWFREGLRARLKLFCAFLSLRGEPALDADRVQIVFTRSLPVNELEIAQTVKRLPRPGARPAAADAGALRGGRAGGPWRRRRGRSRERSRRLHRPEQNHPRGRDARRGDKGRRGARQNAARARRGRVRSGCSGGGDRLRGAGRGRISQDMGRGREP